MTAGRARVTAIGSAAPWLETAGRLEQDESNSIASKWAMSYATALRYQVMGRVRETGYTKVAPC